MSLVFLLAPTQFINKQPSAPSIVPNRNGSFYGKCRFYAGKSSKWCNLVIISFTSFNESGTCVLNTETKSPVSDWTGLSILDTRYLPNPGAAEAGQCDDDLSFTANNFRYSSQETFDGLNGDRSILAWVENLWPTCIQLIRLVIPSYWNSFAPSGNNIF